ncbi:MAG: hypothetical protein U0704_03015 [Candidatus Eisenbacteria bacterium]
MGARIVLMFVALVAVASVPIQAAQAADRTPERIVSKRVRILEPKRYRALRAEWQAYTEAHPRDPVGWSQLAKAAMYDGASCREYVEYAKRAVRLGPNDAEALATLGRVRWGTWCPEEPGDPAEAIRLLERALELNPRLDDPHYLLWTLRMSQGRREEANEHLRALLDGGRMPEPLVDFGYNLLAGLEPNAILLTNGDNDTYPVIALQTARKFRTDVAVVNLSLLNLEWYRRDLRSGSGAVPVPMLEGAADSIHAGTLSQKAVKGLLDQLKAEGNRRPLYLAVTVYDAPKVIPNRLSLEGLVYRALPAIGGEPELDAVRAKRNLDEVYRLSSVQSLSLDWDAWSAVRQLVLNYTGVALKLASATYLSGDLSGMNARLNWILTVMEFHHRSPGDMQGWIEYWNARDADSPELARWKAKYPR